MYAWIDRYANHINSIPNKQSFAIDLRIHKTNPGYLRHKDHFMIATEDLL